MSATETGLPQASKVSSRSGGSLSQGRLFWERRADMWTEMARDEGSFYARRTRLVTELVQDHLARARAAPRGESLSDRVLDVGCGVGLLACALLEAGLDAYGTDLAHSMVLRARERARELLGEGLGLRRFRVCTETTLPFPGPFDVITAIGVFPYVRDYPAFLELLSQRLAPGGILIATTTHRRGLYTYQLLASHLKSFRPGPEWEAVWKNLWRTGLWSGGYLDGTPGRRVLDGPAFDAFLAESGFRILESLDLYHVGGRWLDAAPRRRSRLGKALARRWGWTHLAVARKGLGKATSASRTDPTPAG